jgi:multimeric flavodoxin WrbA
MKKIVAFIGCGRKRHTYKTTLQLLENIARSGEIEYEIVMLNDYRIETCRGCQLCFDKGEELCPLRDDRDLLLEKIESSDAVIFATPNYSFQVSGILKVFLDRMGFLFHRPRFFGKVFTSVVVQGILGGNKIVEYLDFVGNGLGFNTVKGKCLRTLVPMTEKAQAKIDKTLAALALRVRVRLEKPAFPKPGLLPLMVFRMGRTSRRIMMDEKDRDFTYFTKKHWFESDYYYPVRLGPLAKIAGNFFDWLMRRMVHER